MSVEHPSMRRRMQRRQQMLDLGLNAGEAVSLPDQKFLNQHQQEPSLRRGNSFDTLAPSFVTSICSTPSVFSDYGLHRAITAPIVVPNEQNPIATIKDRKNANYVEDLEARHAVLRDDLNEALAACDEISASRDDNRNGILEAMLNRKFLESNNLLARRVRDYNCFIIDIKELQEMPKMSREELAVRYTARKTKEKADREDSDSPDVQSQMREIQTKIDDLELEREDLIKRTGAVDALSEQVAYVEHLNKSLSEENSLVWERFASKERVCDKHVDNLDQLVEDVAYYEYLNAQKNRTNSEMARDLEIQQQHATDLNKQLQNIQADVRNLHTQLTYAKSTAMQLKEEGRSLQREIYRAHDECDILQTENERLRVERERMTEIRELQLENNAHMREEFEEMREQALHSDGKAASAVAGRRFERLSLSGYAEKLKAELAHLKSRAARRDSVVSSASAGSEAKRSASA